MFSDLCLNVLSVGRVFSLLFTFFLIVDGLNDKSPLVLFVYFVSILIYCRLFVWSKFPRRSQFLRWSS